MVNLKKLKARNRNDYQKEKLLHEWQEAYCRA